MTIPISKEIQAWNKGYETRMAGLLRDDTAIEDKYKQEWNAGWDEADEIAAASDKPYNTGIETGAAYTIYDSSGNVIKP